MSSYPDPQSGCLGSVGEKVSGTFSRVAAQRVLCRKGTGHFFPDPYLPTVFPAAIAQLFVTVVQRPMLTIFIHTQVRQP